VDQVRREGGDWRSVVEAARQHAISSLVVQPAFSHSPRHLSDRPWPRRRPWPSVFVVCHCSRTPDSVTGPCRWSV